jgi:hypothetical protein
MASGSSGTAGAASTSTPVVEEPLDLVVADLSRRTATALLRHPPLAGSAHRHHRDRSLRSPGSVIAIRRSEATRLLAPLVVPPAAIELTGNDERACVP